MIKRIGMLLAVVASPQASAPAAGARTGGGHRGDGPAIIMAVIEMKNKTTHHTK